MRAVLTVIVCYVCYETTADITSHGTAITPSPLATNKEESPMLNQISKEPTQSEKHVMSCALNLLKNALAEELQKSYYSIDNSTANGVSVNNKTRSQEPEVQEQPSLEKSENQLEKPFMGEDYETEAKNIYQRAYTLPGPLDCAHERKNVEMPNMIPIFKPRPQSIIENNNGPTVNTPRQGLNYNTQVFPENYIQMNMIPTSSQQESYDNSINAVLAVSNNKQVPISRTVSYVPDNSVQRNMNSIPNQSTFNIPCHRAADVLDMTTMVPKEPAFRNSNVNNVPKVTTPIFPRPITSPVNCVEEIDTIAMLYKPKNITLQQVYGNLLKKITLTILVPYHISKLGEK